MWKIECACGNVIRSSINPVRHKAHFVANQDIDDMETEVEKCLDQLEILIRQATSEVNLGHEIRLLKDKVLYWTNFYQRRMYQCTQCGRLYIQDSENKTRRIEFVPAYPIEHPHLLQSIKGDKWRGSLRGRWTTGTGDRPEQHGTVYWDINDSHDGGKEAFTDWETLEARYYEVFEQLRAKDILRDASLIKSGIGTIHYWQYQNEVK
jgi:hypothetical protein